MEIARKDIERVRKGDFTIRFIDRNGKPVGGMADIGHVNHEFDFGASASGSKRFVDLFNTGRMNPHWGVLQSGEDGPFGPYHWERFDRMLDRAHDQGIRMRYHCLIYEQWGTPKWIDPKYRDRPWWDDIPETEQQWWELIERHIKEVATHRRPCDGKPLAEFVEFDVINEMTTRWSRTNQLLEQAGKPATYPTPHLKDGHRNGARMLCLARKYMPKAKLVALEWWPIGELEGWKTPRVFEYFRRLFDPEGTDPHVRQVAEDPLILLGAQCHVGAGKRDLLCFDKINANFERFASPGKNIAITEYDPPSVPRDRPELHRLRLTPEEQAAWSINFFTLAFSKPYITGISRWAMSDRQSQQMDSGILFADGKPKPEYHSLRELIKEKWTTRWTGPLGPDGNASFRGFFGTYEATLSGYDPVSFTLRPSGPRQVVCVMN
jgi:GH35 family endo-1,4-beta-xylanase